nr:MAG TPA: hypothetical protein [Caudoviricetes sp.]
MPYFVRKLSDSITYYIISRFTGSRHGTCRECRLT